MAVRGPAGEWLQDAKYWQGRRIHRKERPQGLGKVAVMEGALEDGWPEPHGRRGAFPLVEGGGA